MHWLPATNDLKPRFSCAPLVEHSLILYICTHPCHGCCRRISALWSLCMAVIQCIGFSVNMKRYWSSRNQAIISGDEYLSALSCFYKVRRNLNACRWHGNLSTFRKTGPHQNSQMSVGSQTVFKLSLNPEWVCILSPILLTPANAKTEVVTRHTLLVSLKPKHRTCVKYCTLTTMPRNNSTSKSGGGRDNKAVERNIRKSSKGNSSKDERNGSSNKSSSHHSEHKIPSYAEMERRMKKFKKELEETVQRVDKVEEKIAMISKYFDLKAKKPYLASRAEEERCKDAMDAIFREVCPLLLD